MVRESRIIADLLLKKVTPEQWDEQILELNVLQKRTAGAAKRNATAIQKRLKLLEPEFLRALRDGDDELATQVSFCGAMERNLLLVEFIETVIKDAYLTRSMKLDTYSWTDFLEDRSHRDDSINQWKESSKLKMGQILFRMLAEVGYLKNSKSLELQHVIVRPELAFLLDEFFKHRIKKCFEVSLCT